MLWFLGDGDLLGGFLENPPVSTSPGLPQGKISYFHEVKDNPFFLDRERVELPEEFYLTDALNDYALRFLQERGTDKKPFFLYVAHIAPHWPLHAREHEVAPFRQRYRKQGWDQIRSRRLESQRESGLVPPEWKLSPRPAGVGDWESRSSQRLASGANGGLRCAGSVY